MSTNKNALILFWTGNEIPDYLVGKIAELLTANKITIPEMLKVVYKNQDSLADCLVKEAHDVSTINVDIANNKLAESIKQSIIYIGKRFEASLIGANKGSLVSFAIELQSALSEAHNNVGFNLLGASEEDTALINAVEIIATSNAVIPSSLAKKYHFTKQVCDVIKQVYHQFA